MNNIIMCKNDDNIDDSGDKVIDSKHVDDDESVNDRHVWDNLSE